MEGGKCLKEGEFGEIRATLRFFQEVEERRERREEKMAATMERIAEQGVTLEAHAATQARHEEAFHEAFTRLKGLEDKNSTIIMRVIHSRIGLAMVAVVFVGFVFDCINYEQPMKRLIAFLK